MPEQPNISPDLEQAFMDGCGVFTQRRNGITKRRRLADIVLPSGRLACGFSDSLNDPNRIVTCVPAGRYPVFISISHRDAHPIDVAFLSVHFLPRADGDLDPSILVSWRAAGSFFTDSGDGCIYDADEFGRLAHVYGLRARDYSAWDELRCAAYVDGDGSVVLDPETGANAIIFRTADSRYPSYVGMTSDNRPACLVIDGRIWRARSAGEAYGG